MRINLEDFSYEELLTLNELIVERLKFLDRAEAHEAMMQFHPGARVCFESPNHGVQTGTLLKLNQKTQPLLFLMNQLINLKNYNLKEATKLKLLQLLKYSRKFLRILK